jgi:heptosyltransferase II
MRLLLVLPSWVGDATMATPVLRRLRAALPGSFLGAICRPGIDELIAGHPSIDEFHVGRAAGVMGYKLLANKVRPRKYDAALLFTNSFSTALAVRLAGVPSRIGYDRDARGLLLTRRIPPPKLGVAGVGGFAIISAVDYYWRLADAFLDVPSPPLAEVLERTRKGELSLPNGERMELSVTVAERARADAILAQAAIQPTDRLVILNPGANDEAKRWPPERFAKIADWLVDTYHVAVAINGSPNERELCRAIAGQCTIASPPVLADLGITLGALKAIIQRAALLVTNDTGPRHIAAAVGTNVVTLLGPTDYRWALIPTWQGKRELRILADPTLPDTEEANHHPDRCAMTKIDVARVQAACDELLGKGE